MCVSPKRASFSGYSAGTVAPEALAARAEAAAKRPVTAGTGRGMPVQRDTDLAANPY